MPNRSGPQIFESVIFVYKIAEILAPFVSPVAAVDFAHTYREHLRHAVVSLKFCNRVVTVAEGYFVGNESLALWTQMLEMLRLYAPSLMVRERWIVTDRASGWEELLEGYREQHGTAGHLLCAFHILGNLVNHHGNMGKKNSAFWEYVSAGNQEQLSESRTALTTSYPDHAEYLRKIDSGKLVAFEIAQRGGNTDFIRTSNMAEQENSRQKTLRIRSHCAPRGIVEAFIVAHRVIGDVHALLTKEKTKGNVLVPWMNKIYQSSMRDVGKACVERINESTGIVTFQTGEDDSQEEIKARVDFAKKQCSQCCLTSLCGILCSHLYAFAVYTGKLKPAQSRAFFEKNAALRHQVDFVLDGLNALNTHSLFLPVLSAIPLSLKEDLHEPPELEVSLAYNCWQTMELTRGYVCCGKGFQSEKAPVRTSS